MPLKKGNTTISAIYKGSTPISAIYKGAVLVYSSAYWEAFNKTYLFYDLIPQTLNSKTVQDKAKLVKIYGNGVIENQLLKGTQLSDYTIENVVASFSNGVLNCSLTVDNVISRISLQATITQGHKYLFLETIKVGATVPSTKIRLTTQHDSISGIDLITSPTANTTYNVQKFITPVSSYANDLIRICYFEGTKTVGGSCDLSNIMFFDLTLMFGTGNEPTTLTDNRIQALLNRGYIAYNTGSYKNSKVSEIETFNSSNQLLDTITLNGLLELNGAINSHDTFEITKTDYVFTRKVVSKALKDITGWAYSSANLNYYASMPSDMKKIIDCSMICDKYTRITNAYWSANLSSLDKVIATNTGGTTIQFKDTSISQVSDTNAVIYYELATPQVITIPKKHLGCVDLGSLSWTKSSQYGFYSSDLNGIVKKPSGNNITPNIYCSKFTTSYRSNNLYQSTGNNVITIDVFGDIDISTDNSISAADFKSAMAGQYLFYETDAEVSDFDNIAQINAGGSITSNWFSWVRNQQYVNGDFTSYTNIFKRSSGFDLSVADNVATFTCIDSNNGNLQIGGFQSKLGTPNGICLITFEVKCSASGDKTLDIDIAGTTGGHFKITQDFSSWTRVVAIKVRDSSTNDIKNIYTYINTLTNNDTLAFRKYNIIDLTLAFGAGNEPTSENDPRIQYIINKGFISQDTTGTEESVAPEVLPNVDFAVKCK